MSDTIECPTCGGSGGQMHQHIVGVADHAPGCEGVTCERTCPVEVPMPVDEWEPCPDCIRGRQPSREVLRRMKKAIHGEYSIGKPRSYADWDRFVLAAWLAEHKEEEA